MICMFTDDMRYSQFVGGRRLLPRWGPDADAVLNAINRPMIYLRYE